MDYREELLDYSDDDFWILNTSENASSAAALRVDEVYSSPSHDDAHTIASSMHDRHDDDGDDNDNHCT